MFDHEDLYSHRFDSVPKGIQCRLMTDQFLSEFESTLLNMVTTEDEQSHAIYEIGYGSNLVVNEITDHTLDVSWYADAMERFHEVTISIPRDSFIACVECPKFSLIPYIFVSDDWHENLLTREYSIFCLIDAVGFKEKIKNGSLSRELLISLRDELDTLAAEYPNFSFVSFADSLILKTYWKPGYFVINQPPTYRPESMFKVIEKIRQIYKNVIDLDIYAVLTQGSNEYYGDNLLHISKTKNHVSMNSLGVPFAELLAIETTAKKSIKSHAHPPSELYIDGQYFNSIKFNYKAKGGASSVHEYTPIMKGDVSNYYCASLDSIMSALEENDTNKPV